MWTYNIPTYDEEIHYGTIEYFYGFPDYVYSLITVHVIHLVSHAALSNTMTCVLHNILGDDDDAQYHKMLKEQLQKKHDSTLKEKAENYKK